DVARRHSAELRLVWLAAMLASDNRQRRSEPRRCLRSQRVCRVMSASTPIFKKIALIGVGLIGSSIAHASRRRGLAEHIAGYVPRAETRAKAQAAGFADSLHAEIAPAVENADLVVLCTPIGTYGALAAQIAPHLMKGAIISDVGSVKTVVVRDVGPHVPN